MVCLLGSRPPLLAPPRPCPGQLPQKPRSRLPIGARLRPRSFGASRQFPHLAAELDLPAKPRRRFLRARSARTLQSHIWPVRELIPIIQGSAYRPEKGQESVKAGYLESWMRKAIEKLETVQDLPIEEALPKLRDEEKLYDH